MVGIICKSRLSKYKFTNPILIFYLGKSMVPNLTVSVTGTKFVHTVLIPFWILEHPSSGLGVSDIGGNQQMPQKSLWIQPGFIIANRLRSQCAYHIAWQEKIACCCSLFVSFVQLYTEKIIASTYNGRLLEGPGISQRSLATKCANIIHGPSVAMWTHSGWAPQPF
jgi:hypothetical protein